MERFIDAAPGVRLWVEDRGAADASPLLLIMGAQASGLGWPDELVDMLASRHRVIRYDHRDTGRSTWAFDQRPYPLSDLAEDALAVLDGLGVERAHIVGMSLGGMLAQLLVADHPDRLLSATLIGAHALSAAPYVQPDGTRIPPEELPGVAPRLLEMWSRPVVDLGLEAEVERRVEHWRVLGGDQLPFDAEYARALERKIIEHTGHHATSTAHARADASGLLRTEQLARTTVPTLVVSAPAEPVTPPPHPHHLAQAIQGARIVEIPGMGHALPPEVHAPLAAAILDHTTN
ncbi:alpha/beta fold hydrolase [Streptomyces ipomoeae]|uniref:Hydrolase, alpha/beta domain protein n=1 Tax=Streptomyces ipomoeae 91-03 TaxID=698759 RepID=L1KVW1_9ACTN|nr:alpha/beta fold hydrolase [Streptomyces ipomoeae]EKX64679.1 hydrolase, alpha/beta domain protein [Streptomyces ipomoeae 91-03]MDX2697167.1 alpha/beta fold hydrolase [Streptomyces ipomoeae]MDX2824646.1 alpha/beta fold hydrolase [Streptomyces ipomoeae]MDX2842123.1 alpha/beta fold hydrolase [Streptomyces ipomoeae]MDX2877318.1 alpha/beta fold hydrolase [Streptomyces ipomoeae]